MKFGIFVFGDNHPDSGLSISDYYRDVLQIGEWAEELGFRSFWIAEHHFFWFGVCPSPQMILAALAQRTKRIKLGPAVSVLPFRHPLITAEEYALVDQLCGGRLEFAIGSGFVRQEYTFFDLTFEEGRARMWEAFELILKAWTEAKFSYRGKFYRVEDGFLYMKPIQKPYPPTWIAASSDETLVKAGELGYSIMGIPFVRSNDVSDVKAKHDLFKKAYSRAGHQGEPGISVALHVHLQKSDQEAVKSGKDFFNRYVQYYRMHGRPGWNETFESLREKMLMVYTSVDRAVEIFKRYQETGVTEVLCMLNTGGIPMGNIRTTMEFLSKEIMPQFEAKP